MRRLREVAAGRNIRGSRSVSRRRRCSRIGAAAHRCVVAVIAGTVQIMRVFVAGATGAVGARLVPLLVRAGHTVVALVRTPDKANAVGRVGASAVVADALDGAAVRAAVLAARPDVVVHQLTALAGTMDPRRFDRAFAQTNRLRTTGLNHLLAAADEAGTRRIVVQSYCGWPHAPTGHPVKSEDAPLDPNPPDQLRRTLDAIRYLERATTSTRMDGVVLRYGALYGPATGLLATSTLEQIRRRRFPLIGDGSGWWSFLHVQDAAAATAMAIEQGAPGLYNIVDDDPAPVREWLPLLARIVGAKPPMRSPPWLARWLVGEHVVQMMTRARAGSNAKAKKELRWHPVHASWRQGFAEVLAQQG
jgi:nucleoside-diphosphate-sugar epimerase